MNKFNRTPLKREESNFPTGWVCPKCGRVHAPHISGCYCGGYYQQPWYPYTQPWQPPIVWC